MQDSAFQDPALYKARYYLDKLNLKMTDIELRRAVVTHYLEGLYWVLQYYHR